MSSEPSGSTTPRVRLARFVARLPDLPAGRWPAVLVIAAAVLAAGAAGWNNSATNDEPYHILAAWVYVHDGHADLNPEHPPLVKLLAGLPLQPLDLRGPAGAPVERLGDLNQEVRRFLYANTSDSQTILRLARLSGLAVLAALLAATYLWARFAWGEGAGLLALVALAGQPLVLGHAPIVHTDVAAAATWVWTGFLVHRWLGGWRHGWAVVGAAVGLALAVKFSAVYLAVIVATTVLIAAVRRRSWRMLIALAGAGGVALAMTLACTWPAVRHVSQAEHAATVEAFLGHWKGTASTAYALKRLGGVSVSAAHWGLGLAYVHFNNRAGQGVNFLCGEVSTQGFPLYFPIALVLKTSLLFLLAALWGVVLGFWRRDTLVRVLAGVTGFYLLVSLGSNYNIGARHLLPIIPGLALVTGRTLVTWARPARLLAAGVLASSAVLAFPHYIAHFSLLVGGARGGCHCLADSNLDWGQDWRRVGDLARQRGWAPMAYLYLGAANPSADIPGAVDARAVPAGFQPRYVAVSGFVETLGVAYLQAFGEVREAEMLDRALRHLERRGTLVGEVGHTIKIYRLDPEASP
ncbi:MAG TPA: glycosyltransferase family 39 protein [Thermoanaerobaculaceae bacterium]|nr:glycosyltransferase family 39 protein [Thermoanaerobaculaceae bacterium]HPS76714.1 glycosyltransferase family 39 protein [Thermoanaerobaculaceae bacterium]